MGWVKPDRLDWQPIDIRPIILKSLFVVCQTRELQAGLGVVKTSHTELPAAGCIASRTIALPPATSATQKGDQLSMPPLLSSPSLPVRVLAAAVAAALLYYSSHSFRRGAQSQDGTLLSPGAAGDDQPSADYVASPNPMRAVGPKPDDRWRAIVETMTTEVQAADAGEVCARFCTGVTAAFRAQHILQCVQRLSL